MSAAEVLTRAQSLLDEGKPFHAHEVLEGAWKSAPDGERDLWQGLAQIAVGLTHLLRGNQAGAASVLRRGRNHIAPFAAEPPEGIDVPGLIEWADAVIEGLTRPPLGGTSSDPPPTPRLR